MKKIVLHDIAFEGTFNSTMKPTTLLRDLDGADNPTMTERLKTCLGELEQWVPQATATMIELRGLKYNHRLKVHLSS